MTAEAPNDGRQGAETRISTQIQGLEGVRVNVADMAAGDRPDLIALRIGTDAASCLLIDGLGVLKDTLYEALHQCNELEVRRRKPGG